MIKKSVEAIYGLSPMQQGMQFHSLSAPESGVYIQQFCCRLRGTLNQEAFARAWQQVIDRHSILRTAFVWEGLEKPLQAVHHRVEFQIERLDWRSLSAAAQHEALAQWLEADRRQGFQMTKAPLMRVRLIRVSETEYALIWTHHHMLMDGWSVTILLREIFTLYGTGRRHVEAGLNEPRPYRDYIQWIKQQDVTAAARYWRERLKGIETATKLSVIPNVGARATNGAGRLELQRRLSPTVTQNLQQYARRQRLTLNTLVQGAWAYLLSRYSGEEEVVYGTTINGRPADLHGSENMVGLFINTLPLRIKVAPERLLTEWLSEIQRQQGETEAYSYNSLIDIQGWSEIPRGTPLFETILVFENLPISETAQANDLGVKIEAVQLTEQTNFPLTAVAVPGAEMVLLLSYDTQLFDPGASERLLAHWAAILECIASGTGARLGEIKLLAEGERRRLLEEWSGINCAYAEEMRIHQLFERQAAHTPSQLAVISETEQLTYAELNACANQLAHHLRALGVGPETHVGVCLERSPLMLVGMFGALKAGGAYVPLDPKYPAERLAFMSADSRIKALITQRALAENLPAPSIPTVLLDDDWSTIAERCASDPPCQASPDDIAYVIYTSGSTGAPKGVAVKHAGLVNYVTMMIERLGLNPGHRFLQFASLSFDASAVQIYPTLLSGATLVTHRAPGEIPNLDLLRYCEEKGVTVIDLPAGHWSQWIDELAIHKILLRDQFQVFMTGGDRTTPETLRRWADLAQANALFVSSYGPTEATIGTTIFTTTRDEVLSGRVERVTMGRPLGNTRVYVLDTRWWSETPIGVPGELFIGGVGVARNYCNAPGLTAEKFVPDPFSPLAGDRLYRTGDLVRFLPDGALEFLGRIDQQVKIRGLRLEPGEIETALNAYPAVQEGVVLAHVDEDGEKRLVAYLTIDAEQTLTVNSLRQFLKGRLPEHMIPTSFMILDSMPLSPNGKVDRKRLPDAAQTSLGLTNDHAAPRTPLEETLAAIWRDVLKVQQLGVHDSFFALGGHSLIATQLVSRIRDVFRTEISLQDFFLHPTVAELGANLQKALQDGAERELPPLQREPRTDLIPLSYAQERLWFIERMEGGTPIFNLIGVVRLTGELHVAALEGSLNEVVRRHESLRTRFDEVGGVPAQIVMDERPLRLDVVDLDDTPREEREAVMLRFIQAEATQAFDLTQEPLLRAKLLRFETNHHTLILTIHHIISDGWSIGILIREMVSSYRALVEGGSATLAALPIQYADYALWQRKWLVGRVFETELDYWRKQLAGAPPFLELPTDFPRPPRQTYQGAQQIVELEPELLRDLKKLSQQEGATPFMVLLAAFKALIFRYTGQTDVVIGTPVAGRQHTETEALIGFFLNTLVLRTDLSGKPKFNTLLRRVRDVCLGAYSRQNVSFERLIEGLQPERDRRRSPLVQIVFNMLNLAEEQIHLPELMVEGIAPADQWSRFDLTLYAGERNETLFLNAVYNRDLYAAETITRLLGHYVNLLRIVTKRTEQSLDALQFFSPEEVEEIKRGNRVRPHNPFQEFSREEVEQSVAERFEKQVQLFPQKVALRSKRGQITYQELGRAAVRIARDLERCGLGPRDNVALFFDHDIQMIAAMLGALRAGSTYAPLDPIHPTQRLAYILADADCACVLTDKKNRSRVEAVAESFRQQYGRALQVLEVESYGWEDDEQFVETARAHPDSLAYLLYTSGSTGMPKGVMQNQRNLLRHTRAYTNALRIAPHDNLLLLASYTFDASVMDIYGALLNGATLSIYDLKSEGFDGVAGFLHDQEITIFHSTPTVFRQFIARLTDDEQLLRLRLVVLGGEAAHHEDFVAFRRHFPDGCLMVNGLGPTELTLALQYFLDHRSDLRRQTIPVGYAVAEAEILLLNESGEDAGLYAVGEIAIKSAHLAPGYWKQPDLAAAYFRPAGDDPHKRIYLTGDLGRRLSDHSIDFCGRKDSQIKIRGQRIEFGEIEARLSALPEAQAAAVTAQLDAEGYPHLVAYVVGRPGVELQTAQMRGDLRRMLPEFMVPEVFVALEELPLTQTNKVNRSSLPPVDLDQRVNAHPLSVPRTPVEEMIAEIWRLVLPQRQIGVNEDFFAVGGHSLLAVQLISRIRESFGVEIELREIFERPTIAQLAERVAEVQHMRAHGDIGPIQRAARQERLPLANAQRRLWFLNHLEPGNPAYNMAIGFRLTGKFNEEALEWALNETVHRHETLRTTIQTHEGTPYQTVTTNAPLSLNVGTLEHLPEAEKEAAAQEIIRQETNRPFDLAAGPLFRYLVIRLGEREHLLWFTLHHIICDAWSLGILTREMVGLYSSYLDGKKKTLPALPIQYADYALWQSQWLTGEAFERGDDYWKAQLGGEPAALNLPTDHPRAAERTYNGAHLSFTISKESMDALRKLGQTQASTLFMTALAAWKVLLRRYCNQTEIVVGIPVAGRTRPETEALIGMFVNTLVLRTVFENNPTFIEALGEVKRVCLDAYARQDLPFEELVSALQPTRDLSRVPLFEVTFNWLSFFDRAPEINEAARSLSRTGLELSPLVVENRLSKFAMSIIISERPEGLAGFVEYNTNLFEAGTIERLVANFQQLLESIVNTPHERIENLPLLTAAERETVLYDWNRTAAEYPREKLIHELFEEQAERNGEAIALGYGDEHLSYGELNRRANRLAHYLMELGVKAGDRVGVCLERGMEMMVGQMGTLKAGGAYVPLDWRYPEERLRYMVEDSAPAVVLTQSHLKERFCSGGDGKPQVVDVEADNEWKRKRENNPEAGELGLSSGHVAYVIYTSGSTGEPKGVMVEHRQLVARLCGVRERLRFGVDDRMPNVSSWSFDISLLEQWLPLISGGHCRLTDVGRIREMEYLEEEARTATVFNAVASLMEAWVEKGGVEERGGGYEGLRTLLVGGEPVTRRLLEVLKRGFPRAEVVETYGPTETTLYSTECVGWEGGGGKDGEEKPPIGGPIANTRIYILDGAGEAAPVGAPGEMYIGGEQVARGYQGRAELTAERFVPDPFSERAGARMYRTGDLGRWLSDGKIEFIGRNDDQVKIRGYRIELGEIEARLKEQAGVKEAVVVAREDAPREKRLVAYYTLAAGGDAGEERVRVEVLRAELGRKLPDYMVPAAFVMLEEMPLTPSGKLDRRAMPKPGTQRPELGDGYAAPTNDVEEKLAEVWASVLNLDRIGIHDNFFALGGDSILSIQIVVRAKEVGLHFNPRQIFQYQTIAELATVTSFNPPAAAEQGRLSGPAPLTPIQLDLFERELPELQHFNQALMLDLGEEIEVDALSKAIDHLVDFHDALRMRFIWADNRRQQAYAATEDKDILWLRDLSEMSVEDCAREFAALAEAAQRSLNLETGPVFRALLVRLSGAKGWRLMLVAHHLVVDGVSWRILADDLWRGYQQAQQGEVVALGAKTSSYRQWASKLREAHPLAEARADATYWLKQPGLSAAKWWVEDETGSNEEETAARVRRRLGPAETAALLQEVPRAYGIQITEALLSVLGEAVRRWGYVDCVVTAVESHGREELSDALDVTRTVGWFTAVTPVMVDMSGQEALWERVQRAGAEIRASLNAGRSFRQLRYLLGESAEQDLLRREWEAAVSLNYLGQVKAMGRGGRQWRIGEESIGAVRSARGPRRYEVDVTLIVVDEELEISFTYSRERYGQETMEALAEAYIRALQQIISERGEITEKLESRPKRGDAAYQPDPQQFDELLNEVEFEF